MLQRITKLFLLLILVNSSGLYGADPVPTTFSNETPYLSLLPYVEIYEDTS